MDRDDDLEQIAAIRKKQQDAALKDDPVVERARTAGRGLADLCGRDTRINVQLGYYHPLPTDTGSSEQIPRFVQYMVEGGAVLNESGFPVDSSVDYAAKFSADLDNGLLNAVGEMLERRRRSGSL